jgi:hypothetical protein
LLLEFKRNQELYKLKQEEKDTVAEIVGGESALRNLKTKLHQ